ncbi:hypothetical protein QFW77_14650 [Luteimonas sp. RD2P54]|uniref:Uncharacterized protein n=1 Tax=Luteimonas endophytica TaxID=3042023 RepID=A0ABT6JDC6_9GAMM|nr:hypothetical protein [Luteimonas endophytica]MDH5824218.1 hypothetical protein [Luteimonas endophytica]
MRRRISVLAAGLLLAGHVHAGDLLSCQIQESGVEGTAFAWSYAHGVAEGPYVIETSIGTLDSIEGPEFSSVPTLDGEPIVPPPELGGQIRFGKVYELEDRVALAYLVERERDSSATPSELVFLLNKDRTVSDIDLQPGSAEPVVGHCNLIQ